MNARVWAMAGPRYRPARTATRGKFGAFVVAALVIAALSSCVSSGLSGHPAARPSSDEKMVIYSVGRLSFEAPADWEAHGGGNRILVQPSDERAVLDVQKLERTFAGDAACLRDAESVLARGASELRNVRRHLTKFAGRRAVTQEADQGPWHGWAFAVCDGGVQYRVFFSGRSPVSSGDLEAWRKLFASAQLGGSP